MNRNRIALTILIGFGIGLVTLTDIVGRHYATAASAYPPYQTTPTLSIDDVSLVEGNAGTSNMVFTVTLTATGTRPTIGVFYETADGAPPTGATAPSDYTRVSGPLMFPSGAGTTTMTISVPIVGDTSIEPDETFFVNLSRPDGATITDAQGVGTIVDDDGAPSLPALSINSTTVFEGDAGTTDAIFTVSLSAPGSSTVTVSYATADGTATVADNDYMSRSGTLTFPAGDASPKTIRVPVIGDTRIEETESFVVNLSNPVGATIADGQGICLIFTEEECSYTLNPSNRFFPVGGGAGSFNVITTPLCRWSTFTASPWITITSVGGTGSGAVSFSVAPNSTGDRTGYIVINGTISFTVFQNDSDSCFISLSDTAITCYQQGCGGKVAVTAPTGCSWTAISNAPWITINSGSTGTGDDDVAFTLAAQSFTGSNPAPARTGTMTIAGQTVTFSQDGCSFDLETDSQEVHYLAGTGRIGVFTGCDGWTAASNDPWISITSTTMQPGSVTYSFLENTGGRRTGTITIGNRTLTVVQIEAGPPCKVVLSPTNGTASAQGGRGSVSVAVPDRCPWTAAADVSWITIDSSDISGAGHGLIRYTVAENFTGGGSGQGTPGPSRQGSIRVNGQSHVIFQDAGDCPLKLICSFFPGVCQDDGQRMVGQSRAFRDEVLAKRQRGRRYTELYYRFSTEAVNIIMLNPMLILRSRDILERYRPVLESMTRGEHVSLTDGDIEEIDSFLNLFAAKGSVELRDTLKVLSDDLHDPQVHEEFNIIITEGPKRELPGQSAVQTVQQTGMTIAPIGLLLVCLRAVRLRGKKAALKRLISKAIALTMVTVPILSSVPALTASPAGSQLKETRLRSPIVFEANQGQTDSQVKFLSRGEGYNLFLTQTEAVMAMKIQDENRPRATTDTLRMKLIGANPAAGIDGIDKTLGVSNYFVGQASETWRPSVPSYTKVRYNQIYPGVDMVYYGDRGKLEYDFIVAPGADPGQIGVAFEGGDKIELDPAGDIVLQTPAGEVRQRKPVAYQEVHGKRKEVWSRYSLIQNPKSEIQNPLVAFVVGPYDVSRPLVIDPVISYSTYFGGGGNEEGNSIAVDSAGSVYITGFTDSINFPVGNASQSAFGGGRQDAFIVKLDPSGTRVVYSTYLGGNGQDNATCVAVDATGNAFITGFTDSINFPVRNALQQAKRGQVNAFVVKLGPTGAMLSSTFFGGSASDYGSSIAVDATGNIYTAGISTSSDLPMANAIQSAPGGLVDMFAAKIDPSGSRLVYSTYLGGIGIEGASSIAADAAGNLYLTGLTSSPNFRTVNALQSTHGGGLFDAFVVKLNASGTQIVYSTYLGGGGEDRAFRIAVDSAGSAYVTGDTDSINFPLANAAQRSRGGSADAFVAKLNPSGNQLAYSTYLGGSGIDGGTAIAVDSAGNAYVTGFTSSTDFPTTNPVQQVFRGAYDGFIAKVKPSGSALEYSSYFGGSGNDSGFGIATDASGNAYVMGVTDSVNLPLSNAYQTANGGGAADLFIAKIRSGPTITNAMVDAKRLLVFGGGFDNRAKILIDGEEQKTVNDEQKPATALIGTKAGKKIKRGQTVTLQVRNADGTLSNEFGFTRQ